ncbi:Thiamine pyrophosphate-requiring enzyme [Handroanthus impetiginosus]|uniref:acetolactate synthase n=1 Tax=Handroanthus impetiginosus TaxID=429701 RepID=A0A2G9HC54_9LAMI|nr:Thiamine pyrophosphate-requiring enzyme [Handroanthus impetiginosus]
MVAAAPTSTSSAIYKHPFLHNKPKLLSRFTLPFPDNPQKPTATFISHRRCDVLVEALEREGVTDVFAYPGGASMEIHQALTRSNIIRNVLPRHEQGGVFAAEGYARTSGVPDVCIATSGPGATNLVSGLADALFDSVPLVAITGQVPQRMIGTNAFQDTPIVEVTRSITKHNYLVLDVEDIPRIVKEAFFIERSGRPGPVLIDISKDIQQQMVVPNWDQPMRLGGYLGRLPRPPNEMLLKQIVRLISESKKPVLYVGGGCLNLSEELRQFVELTRIPVASTLMGLSSYPCSDEEFALQMLGMHGTVYANYAMDKSDLLLDFGVRFDDRVTEKLEAFASRAKIVHIDIDSAEIGKNKQPHMLDELTSGNAIISTGVGQHQMWAAQFYKYNRPRQWLTSGGLGAIGFGLPAAIGAVVARPDAVVLLGMVVQWEDRFYKSSRAHTYLGNPSNESEIFPNIVKFAEACDIPAARVTRKKDLRAAIQKMLCIPGPYLLDVIVPHQEHVLPMIPSGGAFKDVITEGDGRTKH